MGVAGNVCPAKPPLRGRKDENASGEYLDLFYTCHEICINIIL